MMYSFYAIPVLLASAFIIAVVGIKKDSLTPYVAVSSTLAGLILVVMTFPEVLAKNVISMQTHGWPAPFGITLVIDPLSMFMLLIATGIGFFTALVSFTHIDERKTEYYTLLCLIMVGVLGVIHTGDMFNLFVFVEIMSISSYCLVAYYRNRTSIEGSIKYLIMSAMATSVMLLSIAMIYGTTGTLNMADLSFKLGEMGVLMPVIFGFLMTGLLFKSAVVPFHVWKPDAVMAAPASMAALFVTASLTGVYVIFRMFFTVFVVTNMFIYNMITVMAVVTMLLGAIMAMQQTNILRLLAYGSISQIGYIMLAFGIGAMHGFGFTAAVFHLINVAIFDSLLFFCAAVMIHDAKSSDMHEIGRKVRFSSALGYCFLIGILSSVGVPLLNGFASKWIIYIATLYVQPLLTVVALMVSVLTLAYGMRAFYIMFLSNADHSRKKRIPLPMFMPLAVLAGLCVLLGIYPQLGVDVSEFVTRNMVNMRYILAVLGI